MIVVTGAPFSGKGQFVRSEIARRERDGELGLLLIGFTELYSAVVPGIQSSYRDENVTATWRSPVRGRPCSTSRSG